MSSGLTRPIRYNYKVIADSFQEAKGGDDQFSFLDPQADGQDVPENAILLDPEALNLAWISSIKGCLQNIHWYEAEEVCKQLMQDVMERNGAGRILPDALKTADRSRKSKELVETAVTIAIYIFPTASVERVKVLTRALVFLTLHDDVVQSTTRDSGRTALENTTNGANHSDTKVGSFAEFAAEARAVDPVLGDELVQAPLRWAKYTRNHSTDPQKTFDSFAEYMEFRMTDLGKEYIPSASTISSLRLEALNRRTRPFDAIQKLYIRHAALINNLYSYENERRECGATLLNAVHVLERLLGISPDHAKNVIRTVVWDTEKQLRAEYTRLVELPGFYDEQQRYLKRIIESTVGNVMYSLTTYRYARLTGNLIGACLE
ncbi:uncharacterized protein BJX67DRAFT_382337 [Aspergillus lucknowensis]|uniref:Isoprenoid synthase domain-containing protein n=1 Tax=Aspergillus lucknowensis TaxID=176173 RepID=A0ABR4LN28_9EURO